MEKEGVRTCSYCGSTADVYLSDKGNYFYDYCKCDEKWWEENSEPEIPEEAFLPDPNDGAKAIAAYEKLVKEHPEEGNYPPPDDCDYTEQPADIVYY